MVASFGKSADWEKRKVQKDEERYLDNHKSSDIFSEGELSEISRRNIFVSTKQVTGSDGFVIIASYAERPIRNVLDDIWSAGLLHYFVDGYAYEEQWALQNSDSGRVLRKMGTPYAKSAGQKSDERPCASVGIEPGMHFDVVRITEM